MADAIGVAHVVNVPLGLVLVFLGAVVLRAGASRRLLGAYFALVGLNYLADAGSYLLGTKDAGTLLDRVAGVTRALDPAVLFLFAVSVSGLGLTPKRVALTCAPATLFLVGDLLPLPLNGSLAYALYVPIAYLGAFAVLTWSYLREEREEERDRAGVLVGAFSVVCLTRVPLLFVDLGFASAPAGRASPSTLWMEALLASTLVVFALVLWRRSAHARSTLLVAAGLLAAVDAVWLLRFVPVVRDASFALLYSVRWFLFLAVVTAGLRRHAILGIPATGAPWLRWTYTSLVVLVVAGMTASFVARLPGATQAGALATGGLVGGLVGSAALALRVAVPPLPGEAEWRRAALYRAHVAIGAPRGELDAVRRRLGLAAREAADIESAVAMEREIVAESVVLRGRYHVERVVGVGGFGRAYLARDRVLGDRVVLKELLPAWRNDPEGLARFRREVETALRIRHPNLVELRGLEPTPTGDVLVLGYVEGETLAARLARGPLAEREALRLARGLLAGLRELHRHGVIHRDVKPENVVLRNDGEAVLLDFGSVATSGTGTVAALGAHPGTAGYASPEQARGERVGPASDVYAVGVVLWRALSGRMPPTGRVPDAWAPILQRALREAPGERWPDADALLAALQGSSTSSPTVQPG